MSKLAQDALSQTVLYVDAVSPLSDARVEMLQRQASHVAVVTQQLCQRAGAGSQLAATISGPSDAASVSNVMSNDLTDRRPSISVSAAESVEELVRLLGDSHVEALVVRNEQGESAGLVTRQSLLEALLKERQQNDVAHHHWAESLLAGEKRILEIISTSSSQDGGLTELVEFVETQSDDVICSILLMDDSGTRLKQGASISLPDTFVRAIDGMSIGPRAGACGTAAFQNQPVIIADISNDPRCAGIRDLAIQHGLRACWSSPIRSSTGRVLGTIAMYFRQPQGPTEVHQALINRAIYLAAIAIERKYAEDALTRSEQKLRRAQQIARVGNFELAADGSPTFWSEECFRIVGQEPARGVPSNDQFLDRVIHPEDRKSSQLAVRRALNESASFDYEFRVLWPDGSIRWIHSRGEPVCNDDGHVVSVEGTLLDITERKQAEEALRVSETRSRTLLEGSPVCTKIIDLDSRLQYMSAAGQNQLKICDIEPFYGRTFPPELYPEIWRAPVTEHLERAKKGEISSLECPVRDTNGKDVWYDTTFVPARDEDGHIQYVIVTSVNVTKRRQAEEEARKHRDELAYVSRVSTMGELATGIAHELNQPLSAIASYSCAAKIMAERSDANNDELFETLGKLEEQAIRAGEIVRRLRDFVRKADSVRVRADLNTLVQDVANIVEPDIRHAEMTMTLKLDEPSPVVLVDRIQIQQVLVNLIRNAIDAMQETPAGQREVTVSTKFEDGQAEVTVSDTGKGLSPQEQDQAFNAFFSTKREGMGMGLPISRSIVAAHGGKLWSQSNVGPGATFRFSVPLEVSYEPDRKPTVFIVDDEAVMRDSLRLVVQSGGTAVRCFSSAVEFLNFLETSDVACPACLIADIQMPKITGIKLLEQLNATNKQIPVILVTGHGTPELKDKAEELGAVALLQKPFPPGELQELVTASLKRATAK